MPLRHIPTTKAQCLAHLISAPDGQVSSKALAQAAGVDITLLAFSAGESVSEEEYFGDTLYLLVEGKAVVLLPTGAIPLSAGEVLCVPARTQHALENVGCAFKILQITVP